MCESCWASIGLDSGPKLLAPSDVGNATWHNIVGAEPLWLIAPGTLPGSKGANLQARPKPGCEASSRGLAGFYVIQNAHCDGECVCNTVPE